MTVEISIYYYGDEDFFKDLVDVLKKKASVINRESMFNINLELKVSSLDEVICVLARYKRLDISLYITNAVNVSLFISKRENPSFGNQVD